MKTQVGVIRGVLPGFVTRIHKDSVRTRILWFPLAGVFAEVLARRATETQIIKRNKLITFCGRYGLQPIYGFSMQLIWFLAVADIALSWVIWFMVDMVAPRFYHST